MSFLETIIYFKRFYLLFFYLQCVYLCTFFVAIIDYLHLHQKRQKNCKEKNVDADVCEKIKIKTKINTNTKEIQKVFRKIVGINHM